MSANFNFIRLALFVSFLVFFAIAMPTSQKTDGDVGMPIVDGVGNLGTAEINVAGEADGFVWMG